jgi:hypothetical protein
MQKPNTLQGLKNLLKEIEHDERQFHYREITVNVDAYRSQLYKKNEVFFNAYKLKKQEIAHLITEKKQELSISKSNPEFDAINQYVKRDYGSGVDWGYGGLSLRFIDPQKRFLILTSNGSTAGTGTAMGTGGYYYASCSHFVAFPQYGKPYDCRMPHQSYRGSGQMFSTSGGRLTNEVKANLIKLAEEYCEQYQVHPFDLEELMSKNKHKR